MGHDITEILLKVVLNTIKPTNQPYVSMTTTLKVFCLISFNIKIQLIDQIHINLFFVASGLSPKSNRSIKSWHNYFFYQPEIPVTKNVFLAPLTSSVGGTNRKFYLHAEKHS
jgi:hypothetical protein